MLESLSEQEQRYFFHTYKRLSVEIERGEGPLLFDRKGKQYLDFFGGLAVNALGYNYPTVTQAIIDQAQKYNHLSNYFIQETQILLAEKIISASGFNRIFFSNSGTEAVEGAIKLARKWGKEQGKTKLLALSNAFHGRTYGPLSLMDKPKYKDGYEPFLENMGSIKHNDVQELRSAVNEQTLGVILEFIQGEGGICMVNAEYVDELKKLRDQFGFLIIADEIQSGIGRTGKFFGFEHFNIQPDIAVIAKAIGGGLPLGAILGNERVAEVFTYGVHGTTFGGNPVACAAGIAVMNAVLDSGLMIHAGEIGEYLKQSFLQLQKEFPAFIKEVRGLGCMLGIELFREGQPYVDALMERGFLVNCTNVNVLRFLPPYIVTRDQCDQLVAAMRKVFQEVAHK
ncbi:MAG: aspartate aminotransferase family protein [bacterium]